MQALYEMGEVVSPRILTQKVQTMDWIGLKIGVFDISDIVKLCETKYIKK